MLFLARGCGLIIQPFLVLSEISVLKIAVDVGFVVGITAPTTPILRQRVALIRTLAAEPDILLLDEPFSALDYQTRLEVCDDVQSIIKSEKKTALLVTHDISEAIALSDKVVVLSTRPARVVAEHLIEFGGSSPKRRRECSEFAATFEVLRKELGI